MRRRTYWNSFHNAHTALTRPRHGIPEHRPCRGIDGLKFEVGIYQVYAQRGFIEQRLELGRPSPQGFFACAKVPRRFASDARERQVCVNLTAS
jgi:hypothetical protein